MKTSDFSIWVNKHKCSVLGNFTFTFDEYTLCKRELEHEFPESEGWAREIDAATQMITIY